MEITQTQQDILNAELLFASSQVRVGGCLTEEGQGDHLPVCHP